MINDSDLDVFMNVMVDGKSQKRRVVGINSSEYGLPPQYVPETWEGEQVHYTIGGSAPVITKTNSGY